MIRKSHHTACDASRRNRRLGTWAAGPAGAILAAVTATVADAAGFALHFQNAAVTSRAAAGTAAGWGGLQALAVNPAVAARLRTPRLGASAIYLDTNVTVDDAQGTTAAGLPAGGDGDVGDGAPNTASAALYGSYPVTERWSLGLTVTSPWGLHTDYERGWAGRYHALESRLITANIAPVAAWRPVDGVTIGAGPQIQYAHGTLSNAIDFGSLGAAAGIAGAQPGRRDGRVAIEGDDWAAGVIAGGIWEPVDGTRVGLAYRGEIEHRFRGTADFTRDGAGIGDALAQSTGRFRDTGQTTRGLATPRRVSLGVVHRFSPRWEAGAQLAWTDWSTFDTLRTDFDNPNQPDGVLVQDWRDTVFAAVAASHRPAPGWRLMLGAAYDEGATRDRTRSPRIPTSDRVWLSAGVAWRPFSGTHIRLGYTRVFVDDAPIDLERNQPGNGARGGLTARADASANVLALDVTARF